MKNNFIEFEKTSGKKIMVPLSEIMAIEEVTKESSDSQSLIRLNPQHTAESVILVKNRYEYISTMINKMLS